MLGQYRSVLFDGRKNTMRFPLGQFLNGRVGVQKGDLGTLGAFCSLIYRRRRLSVHGATVWRWRRYLHAWVTGILRVALMRSCVLRTRRARHMLVRWRGGVLLRRERSPVVAIRSVRWLLLLGRRRIVLGLVALRRHHILL